MTAPELHAYYQQLTGQKLTASYARMETWTQFVARGLTKDDLNLVYRWTKRQADRGEGGFSPLSLQFGRMVADLDRFEDRLQIARSTKLARPATPKPAPSAPPSVPTERPADRETTLAAFQEFMRPKPVTP